jgi:hypothetical protein
MTRLFICFVMVGLFCPEITLGQEDKTSTFTAKGYLKFLQTVYYQDFNKQWLTDNLIHNRLNFKWLPNEHFNASLEVRNRFFYGQAVETIPNYSSLVDTKTGYVKLSKVLLEGDSYFLHTTVDRAYFDLIFGKLQIRTGRQRINWSQNLVWNPNDIFNAYSYFDFDYEERPGTDAIKIQYYTGLTSNAEIVYEVADKLEKMAFAGMYRLNKGGYDYQFLGGYVKDDWVLGTGWSGHIGGAAFRGELSYFYTNNDTVTQQSQFVGAISADYTFKNSLYTHLGIIYNSKGSTGKAPFPQSIFFTSLSAKNLTPARTELLAQVSYPFTPLINGGFAAIINPLDGSYFFGPSFTMSLQDNLELLLMGQFFEGNTGTEYGDIGKLLYWRLKWSF